MCPLNIFHQKFRYCRAIVPSTWVGFALLVLLLWMSWFDHVLCILFWSTFSEIVASLYYSFPNSSNSAGGVYINPSFFSNYHLYRFGFWFKLHSYFREWLEFLILTDSLYFGDYILLYLFHCCSQWEVLKHFGSPTHSWRHNTLNAVPYFYV